MSSKFPDWFPDDLRTELEGKAVIDVPVAGKALGHKSDAASYKAAAEGHIKTISTGDRRRRVPVAWLLAQIGLDV
jgi:hypothetical protein